MRRFVIGDIHGNLKALKSVLRRANFDNDKDKLISLGDLTDRWPESRGVIDRLMKIKNIVLVRGNHDQWFMEYLKDGSKPVIWTRQGGQETIRSYIGVRKTTRLRHLQFLEKSVFYHEEDGKIFVHGGFPDFTPPHNFKPDYLMWDRILAYKIASGDYHGSLWKEVYLGHTSIYNISSKPICLNGAYLMDTGGGNEGLLSMMNIDSKELFQSDLVYNYY